MLLNLEDAALNQPLTQPTMTLSQLNKPVTEPIKNSAEIEIKQALKKVKAMLFSKDTTSQALLKESRLLLSQL